MAGFGLPAPLPARIAPHDEWSLAADIDWSSTALVQRQGSESLVVDAETREARVTLARSLSSKTALQIRIPYRYTGGGTLDSFIDSWHDLFNLPEGARNNLPQDEIRIDYRRDGTQLVDIGTSTSGVGDVSIDIGRALLSSAFTSAMAWLSIKAPTGDSDKLIGSDAFDASLAIAAEHRMTDRWTMFAQGAVTYLGDGDLLPRQQREVVWSGLAGTSWRAFNFLDLKVQLDAHGGMFDATDLEYLGDAVSLTIGGDIRLNSHWRVDLAVSEDIVTESSPDVVFIIGISRSIGE